MNTHINPLAHRRRIAAGNWKMNGTSLDLEQISKIAAVARKNQVQTVICLPATLLDRARDTGILLGGQDCQATHRRGGFS